MQSPEDRQGRGETKLLKATTLSSPLARAISVFAAHSATRKTRMPALHIANTVREIPNNVSRLVVCMWMPGVSLRTLSCSILGLPEWQKT